MSKDPIPKNLLKIGSERNEIPYHEKKVMMAMNKWSTRVHGELS
jgi:hypothetical protein